jgi:hypothetical protein
VAARWLRSLALLACAALLLAGCGDAGEPVDQRDRLVSPDNPTTGPRGQSAASPSRQEDAAALVERALAARAANDQAEFAALVSAASQACPDPGASRRLGEVAGIAARWASALLEGRPKAQAVTEAQLATVDWDALAAACVAARS